MSTGERRGRTREDWQTQNSRGTVSLFLLEEATMERLTVYHNPG